MYLKSYTRARVAAGQLSATLPYSFSYADGKFDASLAGAKLSLRDLALAREGATDSFAALTRLDVNDIDADLARRQATVGEVRADGGKLTVRRDAKGELDLANLMIAAAGPAAAPRGPVPRWPSTTGRWRSSRCCSTRWRSAPWTRPSARRSGWTPDKVRLQLRLAAEQTGCGLPAEARRMPRFRCADLALASGAQTPFKLAQLGFTDGTFDLAARRAGVGRLYAAGRPIATHARPRRASSTCWACCPGSLRPASTPQPRRGIARRALGRHRQQRGAGQVRRRRAGPGRGRQGPCHRPRRETRRRQQRPQAARQVRCQPEPARRRPALGARQRGARTAAQCRPTCASSSSRWRRCSPCWPSTSN